MQDFKQPSDEELMQRYQMGSTAAFDSLFQRHSSRVFAYLSKRLNQKRQAEDLLQEVFLKLHRSKHLYDKALPFSPWLFTIARSVLLDFAKKKNLEDPVELTEFAQVPAPEKATQQNQLSESIARLPSPQQEVLRLRIYDEQTFNEIAARLATSPENARQLFSRAVKRLRELLTGKADVS